MNITLETIRLVVGASARYKTRLATNADEVRAAQALRYQVFNLELNEGLASSHTTGLDADPFDAVCDHLLVEHLLTREIVGTYRLQTGRNAARQRGYYCEQEFDFAPYASVRGELIELGRACVHQQHRNLIVLGSLWKGIADYAKAKRARYLIGCSSLTSQDAAVGARAYAELCRHHLVRNPWRTHPLPAFECALHPMADSEVKLPKLLRAYLTLGAKICGPPALDQSFKTIDFLTMLDLDTLPRSAYQHFFT